MFVDGNNVWYNTGMSADDSRPEAAPSFSAPPRDPRMTVGVALLTVILLFLLAGAIPVRDGVQAVVFRTPVFIGLLALLCVSLGACVLRYRFSARQVGFHLVHVGIIVIIAGAAIGFFTGRSAVITLPITGDHTVARVRASDDSFIPLGFRFAVTDFSVEMYEPDYALFRPTDTKDNPDYTFVRMIRANTDGVFVVSPSNRVGGIELQIRSNVWMRQYVLDNGLILQKAPAVPRRFDATLKFSDTASAAREVPLRVNHPVTHHGWRFYLMSYQEEPELCVELTVRKDPGRRIVIAGMYALMLGTLMLCFTRTRERHAHA